MRVNWKVMIEGDSKCCNFIRNSNRCASDIYWSGRSKCLNWSVELWKTKWHQIYQDLKTSQLNRTSNGAWRADRQCSSWAMQSALTADGTEMKSWVSSAYCWWSMPWEFINWPMGDMYEVNKRGPSTDPWGTPEVTGWSLEWQWPTVMCWLRPDKYELIQLRAASATPKSVYSLLRRVLWSMVSNAALRSSETRTVGWLWSAAE